MEVPCDLKNLNYLHMKIALYGKTFSEDFRPYISELLGKLAAHRTELSVFGPFHAFIGHDNMDRYAVSHIFTGEDDFQADCELMVSIGGDGTFLESLPIVIRHDIPVVGINSGRLGFLSYISRNDINQAFDSILDRRFDIEYRSLICVASPDSLFVGLNFALNDITVHKSDSSLITVDASIDGEFLTTYWTDGLIISTPTGSTAYALSVGGPVVAPGSGNLIIAPIASHNLSVRPLIVPDTSRINLRVNSRNDKFFITADNRTELLPTGIPLAIGKASSRLKMIRLHGTSFYATLRNKLMWGVDKRN